MEDEGPRVPDWIVIFSDMVSLLVTFFILLMTFSSMNVLDAFQVEGRLSGLSGQVKNEKGESAPDPLEHDLHQPQHGSEVQRQALALHDHTALNVENRRTVILAFLDVGRIGAPHQCDIHFIADTGQAIAQQLDFDSA